MYDNLFIEFHYLYFGSVLIGIIPILFKNAHQSRFVKILHPTLLILFVGFFVGAYITPFLYNETTHASSAARRLFRIPMSKEGCSYLTQKCDLYKVEQNWEGIMRIAHGKGLIRAGIQPTDSCYMGLFETIAWAEYALLMASKSSDDIQIYIQTIQKEYTHLLLCQKTILSQLTDIPLTEPISKPEPYPKDILQKAKQWTHATINTQKYEIITPELVAQLDQAIQEWTTFEKRRTNAWK